MIRKQQIDLEMKSPNELNEKVFISKTEATNKKKFKTIFLIGALVMIFVVISMAVIGVVVFSMFIISQISRIENTELPPFEVDVGCVVDFEKCPFEKRITEDWFWDLLKNDEEENILGEYLNNQVWYKADEEGNARIGHDCGCKANDFRSAPTESREVERFVLPIGEEWSWWNAIHHPQQLNETFIPQKVGDEPLKMYFFHLDPSLYSIYLYGTVKSNGRTKLNQWWNPASMEFKAYLINGDDENNKELIDHGIVSLKQGFNPRRMQGFHFRANSKGHYLIEFKLHHQSEEEIEIMWIRLVDQMFLIPDMKIKESQNIDIGVDVSPIELTEQRLVRDKQIWNNFVNFNMHTNLDGQEPEMITTPSNGGNWDIQDWKDVAYHRWVLWQYMFPNLTLYDTESADVMKQDDILSHIPFPNSNYQDYGACVYENGMPKCQLAHKMGKLLYHYYGTFSKDSGWTADFAEKCFTGEDPNNLAEIGEYCHEGALALIRFVMDWPAIELSLRDIGKSTHSPDSQYDTDWSTHTRRNGKFYYNGWSGANTRNMLIAYDQLFPYISKSQTLVESVKKFVPWIQNSNDIIKLIDRYLVFASVRDFNRGLISTNSIPSFAGKILGIHPFSYFLFDNTKIEDEVYPVTGTVQELYAKAWTRDGVHYIGSVSYAVGMAKNLISKASTVKIVKEKGISPKMDLTNIDKFGKIDSAIWYLFNIYVAGGYRLSFGDASSGPHQGVKDYFGSSDCDTFRDAYNLFGNKLAAWGLVNKCSETDPNIIAVADTVTDPIKHSASRIIPSTSGIIEVGTDEESYLNKHAVTLKIGLGQGHSHGDFLDLNIFSMGLPMAVDLGQRNEGNLWTYPSSTWSYLHNHAFGHDLSGDNSDDNNPKFAGQQNGEPWISSFGEQFIRGKYVDGDDVFVLNREVIVMDLEDVNNIYVIDLQRVTGGALHTWNFHGAESENLQINIAMSSSNARWINRHLTGTRKEGIANSKLEAIWEMSRESFQYSHDFDGGGTITTKKTEQTVLGSDYDENREVANVKATLLGRSGDNVYEGFAFSENYDYAFPFLYVQSDGHSASDTTIFPAIYEMYRGSTPLLSSINLISSSPLQIEVTSQRGQSDSFFSDNEEVHVISRDSQNDIRFAKLNGGNSLSDTGISISVSETNYPTGKTQATIISLDYSSRTIVVDSEMPKDPFIVLSNPERSINLQLFGNRGTTFTFKDDLLVSEGEIIKFDNLEDESIKITTNQGSTTSDFVLFTNSNNGNRKATSFTLTNEAHTVAIRNQRILFPSNVDRLEENMFTDANNDGKINLKAYDIGLGETITLTVDVTVKRFGNQYKIKSNVPVSGVVEGFSFSLNENADWQTV